MARRLTEGVERDITGDKNYGLNFYEESSDTSLPLPTYTSSSISTDFLSCGRANLPPDNALYGKYSLG